MIRFTMADPDESPLFDEVTDSFPKENESDEKKEDESKKTNAENVPASIPVTIEPDLIETKNSKVIILLHTIVPAFILDVLS